MLDIETLTIAEARNLARTLAPFLGATPGSQPSPASHPLVGQIVCVETIVPWYVGTLESATATTLTLHDVAWVADSGRYSEFASGKVPPKEVEPLPDNMSLVIERSAVISVRPHCATLRVLK